MLLEWSDGVVRDVSWYLGYFVFYNHSFEDFFPWRTLVENYRVGTEKQLHKPANLPLNVFEQDDSKMWHEGCEIPTESCGDESVIHIQSRNSTFIFLKHTSSKTTMLDLFHSCYS